MVFLVAEIGVNWDGDIELASEMMQRAKNIGFSAVKFQSFNEAKYIFTEFNLKYKFVIQKEEELYSLIVGPLNNEEAKNRSIATQSSMS